MSRLRRRIAEDRSDLTLAAFAVALRRAGCGDRLDPLPTGADEPVRGYRRLATRLLRADAHRAQEILRQGLVKSDLDEDMVVGFVFRSPGGDADNEATRGSSEASCPGQVDQIGDQEILIDLGPLLGQHEPEGRPRPSASPRPRPGHGGRAPAGGP